MPLPVICRPFGTFCRSLPASRGPCGGQGDNLFPKLFFLFLFVFIGFLSVRFAEQTDLISAITMSLHPYSMCLFAIWGFYAKVSCRETFGFLPRNRWFLGRKLLKPMLP
jgi:hypothetical protein